MYRDGHIGAALLGYSPLGFIVIAAGFPPAAVGGGLLAAALAMLPDWDMKIPGVKHRGATHTVHFAAVVAVATGLLGAGMGSTTAPGDPVAIVAAGAFGAATGAITILSHIGADALTPMGVKPLGDDGPHVSYDLCRADSTVGNTLLLGAGATAAIVAFYAGEAVRAGVAG